MKEHYDLIIIDGPNGNGRNIAYLHIKDRVKKNSIIFIDDYNSKDNNHFLSTKELQTLIKKNISKNFVPI